MAEVVFDTPLLEGATVGLQSTVIVAFNVGLLAFALLLMAAYAYRDAPTYDMNPTKWAAISLFVPLFGFFAYIFEREERMPDPEHDRDEMFVDGAFEIHKSRADDVPWVSDPEDDPSETPDSDADDDPWGADPEDAVSWDSDDETR
jgi:hypothetical protein